MVVAWDSHHIGAFVRRLFQRSNFRVDKFMRKNLELDRAEKVTNRQAS